MNNFRHLLSGFFSRKIWCNFFVDDRDVFGIPAKLNQIDFGNQRSKFGFLFLGQPVQGVGCADCSVDCCVSLGNLQHLLRVHILHLLAGELIAYSRNSCLQGGSPNGKAIARFLVVLAQQIGNEFPCGLFMASSLYNAECLDDTGIDTVSMVAGVAQQCVPAPGRLLKLFVLAPGVEGCALQQGFCILGKLHGADTLQELQIIAKVLSVKAAGHGLIIHKGYQVIG